MNPLPPHAPRLPALLLATLLATGCAVGPDFQAPTPPAPADSSQWQQWHSGSADLLDASRRGTPQAALGGWEALNDAQLTALQQRALDASPDLRTAALRFAQSRVQRQMAGQQLAPRVDATGGIVRQRQSEVGSASRMIDIIVPPGPTRDRIIDAMAEPFTLYDAGFDAVWELDLWGRVRRAIEAADADQAAQAALQRQVRLALQAEVARHYFELRGAQRQLAIARADLQAADEALALAQSRERRGLVDAQPATRQRELQAGLRERVPALQQREAQSLAQLTLLLGEAPGALNAQLMPAAPQAAPALPDLALGLPSTLVAQRPDIAAAQARLAAATARIGVAQADLYPRVTLGAGLGFESVGASSFGDWGSRQWRIGPSLTLPIFEQGRLRGTVQLRELQQQEAAIDYQQTVLKAWHEVDGALTSYTAEQQRHVQLLARVREGRDALALAQARERGGLADWGPTLDAQRTLLAAQREEADSASRLALGLVAVYKSLGV